MLTSLLVASGVLITLVVLISLLAILAQRYEQLEKELQRYRKIYPQT